MLIRILSGVCLFFVPVQYSHRITKLLIIPQILDNFTEELNSPTSRIYSISKLIHFASRNIQTVTCQKFHTPQKTGGACEFDMGHNNASSQKVKQKTSRETEGSCKHWRGGGGNGKQKHSTIENIRWTLCKNHQRIRLKETAEGECHPFEGLPLSSAAFF